jgi:diamine N-acetyltransferase
LDFTIRKATKKDFKGLVKIYNELNILHSKGEPDVFVIKKETPQNLEFVGVILKNKDAVLFVAQSAGEIIGLIQANIMESPDIPIFVKRKYIHIEDICVEQKYRRSSVGKRLMESVEQWAVTKGISEIDLNVWDFNKNAMAFFKNIGYTPSRHYFKKKIEWS